MRPLPPKSFAVNEFFPSPSSAGWRFSAGVNLTLFCGFGNETPVIQAFLSRFEPRIPDAAEFAEDRRVILLKTSEGIPIDVALAGFPFEES
jgi:hypothetical protein